MIPVEYHRSLKDLTEEIMDCLAVGLVPMVRGSPALGKSAVIHYIAKLMNLLVIDARFAGYDPTDINGFPDLDKEKGIASYYPLDTFPLEGRELPINPETGLPYAGWLVFCDELNSAPPAVQAASYKLFLDRMVGQRKLHPAVHLAAAGNLDTDQAITHEMSTALLSRLINFVVLPDLKGWLGWAAKAGVNSLITSFLEFRTGMFYTFDPEEPGQPFAAPRTWEFVDKLLTRYTQTGSPISTKVVTLVGTVGAAAAVDFVAFAKIRGQLPTQTQILNDPANAPMPRELGPLYALSGAIGDWADASNIGQLMKYVSRMHQADLQVTAGRNIILRNPELGNHPEMVKWMEENMDAFLGY